ncbi:HNH endonuclease [Priestia sp. SIMBA_032]|uniref:HNH endonuclease n=1 Tax=Priestia sp. SIMBA_032 TaxID=3085775 RepID=UPI003979A834
MSKSNEMIRLASQRGYTVNKDGEVLNPKGGIVVGSIRNTKKYFYKTFGITYLGMSRPILVHRFVAYKKFGEVALEGECIRHLNGNSLDNRPDNIDIGTYREIFDATRNKVLV